MEKLGSFQKSNERLCIITDTAQEIVEDYKIILRKLMAYTLRSIALLPLAAASKLTLALAKVLRFADKLEGYELESEAEPEAIEKSKEREELVIPSPVLYETFRILLSHGKDSREWIVALGSQKIDGKTVLTRVYDIECAVSHSTSAEPDYSSLAEALRFYEKCGYEIAGLAHIHPWFARTVSPSSIDIETHRRWEELYNGRFIGIVFNNSGVFRIFHGGKSVFKPVVVGKGVKKIGRDLYELERKNVF